jgi:amidohydrolase
VFQPAEELVGDEGLGGAETMIRDGVLGDPKPDFALALHLWNEKPLGWLGVAAGPVMAGAELFKVRIIGKGGHGAVPNATVDPIMAAAQIVTALQSIVARNVGPLQTAVVSVTSFHAGTAFNVIPQEVTLEGTIRSFDLGVRERVLRRFEEIIRGVGSAMGCEVDIVLKRVTPAVVNSAPAAAKVQAAAQQVLPESELDTNSYITMGAEDMAFMLEKVPGCFFFVGSANGERNLDFGHHHPKFDFDEAALPRAAALMAASAAEFLK